MKPCPNLIGQTGCEWTLASGFQPGNSIFIRINVTDVKTHSTTSTYKEINMKYIGKVSILMYYQKMFLRRKQNKWNELSEVFDMKAK